jgi:hypothetical protein
MPFQYTLANLLAANEGTVAVLFLDETGETVDMACSEYTPYQMKIVGAYLGIYWRQVSTLLESLTYGEPTVLHMEKGNLHFFAAPLRDGYYLALVQRRPAVVARTRHSLQVACDEIIREIFT